jgi:hypothetical protein
VTITENRAAVWFGRVMWLGIVANLSLALPTLVAPDRMMAFAGVPPAAPLVWVRFSALLLILLSVFYMPAAVAPWRYPAVAWIAVLSRAAGVVFFGPQATYRMFGLFDLVFLVPEGILLAVAMRQPLPHVVPQAEGGLRR